VAGPRELVAAMASLRARIDTLGDPVGEWALAELLEEGAIERHAHRMRRVYRSRRDALVAALERSLAERLTFDVPPGGMALWAKARGRLDVDAWAERALAHGVGFAPASRFTFGGARAPFVRLGFAAVTEAEIEQGVGVLARTIDRR
jgi:GntR family transcriptional regulator/MocR family aminotransferase